MTIRPARCARIAGQHELAHAHEAEDVGLELAADHVERHALDRPRLAVARVVDQRPDRAVLGLDRRAPRPAIEASSVTSSASRRQPLRSRSAIDSGRRALA